MSARVFGGRFAWKLAAGLLVLATAQPILGADDDEPRGLGRLFRFGNRNQASKETEAREKARTASNDRNASVRTNPVADPSRLLRSNTNGMAATPGSSSLAPYGSLNPTTRSNSNPRTAANTAAPDPYAALPPDVGAPPPQADGALGPRLVPQPRNSRPVTDAPPLLTRVQIGRSDDGHTFGMFLQIYSDGTVIDTEGVHKVGRDVLAPVVEALRAADAGRIHGHCGSPPVDYIETVLLVVYDSSRGRLQANSFSYSGNTQGCSPGIRALQVALDGVQAKISPAPASMISPEPAANGDQTLAPFSAQPGISTGLEGDAAPAPPTLSAPANPNPSIPPLRLTPVDGE
jgi:hypothetical protein